MRNFIYQGDDDSCGLATLKMLLLELTKKKGYRYMNVEKDNPLSLEDIRQIAFKEGVDIQWKRCNNKEALCHCSTFPLLVVIEKRGKSHLVLLKKANKRKALIYDPSLGPKWIDKEDLIDDFSGVYGEANVFDEEKCPYSKPKIFKKRGFVITSIVTILGIISLYLGLTYMGGENAYIPIAFLSIYGLCSIGSRFLNEHFSKSFDRKWLKYITSSTKKRLIKNYERYYFFKSKTFPVAINVLESVSVVFGLNFLYGLNNVYFLVSVVGLSIYLVLESKIYRQGLCKQKEELMVDEANLLDCKDSQREQLAKMRRISGKANRIGMGMTYVKIIYFAIVAGLAFIPPFMKENLSLNYYLFHLFGLLAVGQGIRCLLGFFESKSEREKAYSYFLETFVKKESTR